MPSASRESSAAGSSPPEKVRPLPLRVKLTRMGLRETSFTASTAARASLRESWVSTAKKSTPAASSASACSR